MRSVTARKLLEGPRFPDDLAYLWDWAIALHGRSGVGMMGLLPLTYSTIRDWAGFEDVEVRPHEVQALLIIDRTLLYPSEEEVK
jgi:hypothetical protein